MTTGGMEQEMTAGPSTARTDISATPKLDHENVKCYVTLRLGKLRRQESIELCKTFFPFIDSPMSPPPHRCMTLLYVSRPR